MRASLAFTHSIAENTPTALIVGESNDSSLGSGFR